MGSKEKLKIVKFGVIRLSYQKKLLEVRLSELIFTLKTRGMATNTHVKNVFQSAIDKASSRKLHILIYAPIYLKVILSHTRKAIM